MDEEQKQAWKKFQDKMKEFRKKQAEVLRRISEKLDKQRKEKIIAKLNQND